MKVDKTKCKKLIEYRINSKHRSKWIKSKIRKIEKIEYRNIAEQWKLCQCYAVLVSVPFEGSGELYKFCEKCEHGDVFLKGKGLTHDLIDSVHDSVFPPR